MSATTDVPARVARGPRTVRRVAGRRTAVHAALAGLLLGLALLALLLGELRLTPREVLDGLLGSRVGGSAFVVRELRLPRLLLGLLVGAALGLAGAVFQAVLRNPLASPDVLGVTQGASAAAVATLLLGGLSGWPVVAAAAAGGVAVGVTLQVLAGRGGAAGQRFVLCGVGLGYLGASVTAYLVTRADLRQAQDALLWTTGSLGQASWPLVRTLGLALLVLVPLVAGLAPRLALLQLGDASATALGARPERTRALLLVLAVLLAAAATAAAGPVAFVAFLAAPLARRLLADGSAALAGSALVGAVLVVGCDLLAQHALPGDVVAPVGVLTGALGAPLLVWLLVRGPRPA
ncbi:iron ABC transporter permease [Nocardioides sp. TRM66260-LWL]|uniref:FecCD family ABC transporter permease n=1 Tax=Nocardioides sp. TRM66260-LWL TaxID=2874478 RepID=UPI001CC80022|nr:iron ABC transporter permease [Nocardioides sp. TRM66260-LWL]MBZ5733100.1 iron ABC transporter permease [Nocardioides sp. TRM66260-LWL]